MKKRQKKQKEYVPSSEISSKISNMMIDINMSMNKNACTSKVEGKDPKTDFTQAMYVDKKMGNSMKQVKKAKVPTKNIVNKNNMVIDMKNKKKKNHNKNIRFNKARAAMAEKNRKNHISHLSRNKVNKAKIIEFACKVAAKKIQRSYRDYLEEKKERERIRFELAKKRCMKNYARATIRKYVTLSLMKRRAKKEMLEYHNKYHLDQIKHIQTKYRYWKASPKKINVPRFKQIFHAFLLGWRVRRIIGYLHNVPQVREAIDYIKLKNDIKEGHENDPFSRQILEKYPGMVTIFTGSFDDLIENAVWIKRPNIQSQKKKKSFTKANKERSKPNKIPNKPVKKANPKRKSVKKLEPKMAPETEGKQRNSMKCKSSLAITKEISMTTTIDKPVEVSEPKPIIQKKTPNKVYSSSMRSAKKPVQIQAKADNKSEGNIKLTKLIWTCYLL
jgi:hypothetical protein